LETPALHSPATSPGLQSDIAFLLPPGCKDSAQTSPPSEPLAPNTRAPSRLRPHTALLGFLSLPVFSRHPTRTATSRPLVAPKARAFARPLLLLSGFHVSPYRSFPTNPEWQPRPALHLDGRRCTGSCPFSPSIFPQFPCIFPHPR